MAFDRMGESIDIDEIVMISRHRADCWLPSKVHQRSETFVIHRRRRRGRIMRIKWVEKYPFAAGFLKLFDPAPDRRLAVAHRPFNLHRRKIRESVGKLQSLA